MADVSITTQVLGLDRIAQQLNALEDKFKDLGNNLKSTGDKLVETGKTLSTRLTLPIAGLGGVALKVAADFEASMNRVGALTQATGDQFAGLRDLAKEMGTTTKFSASEAADAMGFLAQGGMNVQQIMTALPSVLNLAASAQISLAQAADDADGILSSFGKSVEELANVNDVLIATTTSSSQNFSELVQGMKPVAPLFRQVGGTIEELSAMLGVLADNNIKGSEAGTALRGALASLLSPVGAGAKAIERLGLQVNDSNGNFVGFTNVLRQLSRVGASTKDVIDLFGREGAAALSILVAKIDDVDALNTSLHDVGGTAQRLATEQSKGLTGAMQSLRSALEGLAIAIGDSGLLDLVTAMVNKATDVVRVMIALPEPVKQAGLAIAAILGAGGPVLIAIGMFSKAIGLLIAGAGPVGLLIAAASALVTVWTIWGDDTIRLVKNTFGWVSDHFTEFKDFAIAVFHTTVEAIKRVFFDGLLGDVVSITKKAAGGVIKVFEWAKDVIVGHSIVPDTITMIGLEFDKLPGLMVTPTEDAADGVIRVFGGLKDKTAAPLKDVAANVKHVTGATKDLGIQMTESEIQARNAAVVIGANFAETGDNIERVLGQSKRAVSDFFFDTIKGSSNLGDAIKGLFSSITDSILREFARLASDRVFRVMFGSAPTTPGSSGVIGGSNKGIIMNQQGGLMGGQGGMMAGLGSMGTIGLLAAVGSQIGGRVLDDFKAGDIGSLALDAFGLPFVATAEFMELIGLGDIVDSVTDTVGDALGSIGDFFGGLFATGGSFIATRPKFIGVGERGPERVDITPLSAGRGSGGSGGSVVVNISGPAVFDSISMQRFIREVQRGLIAEGVRVR